MSNSLLKSDDQISSRTEAIALGKVLESPSNIENESVLTGEDVQVESSQGNFTLPGKSNYPDTDDVVHQVQELNTLSVGQSKHADANDVDNQVQENTVSVGQSKHQDTNDVDNQAQKVNTVSVDQSKHSDANDVDKQVQELNTVSVDQSKHPDTNDVDKQVHELNTVSVDQSKHPDTNDVDKQVQEINTVSVVQSKHPDTNDVDKQVHELNTVSVDQSKHPDTNDVDKQVQEINTVSVDEASIVNQKNECEKDNVFKNTCQTVTPQCEKSERDVPLSIQKGNSEQAQKTLAGAGNKHSLVDKGSDLTSQCLNGQRKTLVEKCAYYCNKSEEDRQQTETDGENAILFQVSADSNSPLVSNSQAVCVTSKSQEVEVAKKVPCVSQNLKLKLRSSKENYKEKLGVSIDKWKRKRRKWKWNMKRKLLIGPKKTSPERRKLLMEQKKMDELPGLESNPCKPMLNPAKQDEHGPDYNARVWTLAKSVVLDISQKIYIDHFAWFRDIIKSNLKSVCHSYHEYVILVKLESAVAIVFNKHARPTELGLSASFICKNWPENVPAIKETQLSFLLTRSPLFEYQNDSSTWKKCYINNATQEGNHWQGILYMRKVWADLCSSEEEGRYMCLKMFLLTTGRKSVLEITGAICKTLHIPVCFEIGRTVGIALNQLCVRGIAEVKGVAYRQANQHPSDMPPPSIACSQSSNQEGVTESSTNIGLSSADQSSEVVWGIQGSPVTQKALTDAFLSSAMETGTHKTHSYELIQNSEISSSEVSALTLESDTSNDLTNDMTAKDSKKSFVPQPLVSSVESISSTEESTQNTETRKLLPKNNVGIIIERVLSSLGIPNSIEKTVGPPLVSLPSGSGVSKKAESSPAKKKRLTRFTKGPPSGPQYYLPLSLGWVREIVTRATSDVGKPARDIYYHPPVGKKLRSCVEVQKYLEKEKVTNLTIENFSYYKEALGYGAPYELERNAKGAIYFKRKSEGDDPAADSPVKKLKVSKKSLPADQAANPPVKKLKVSKKSLPADQAANPPLKKLKVSKKSLPADQSTSSQKKKKKVNKNKLPADENLLPVDGKDLLLNDSWSDEVAITNEVGETTGYEDWISNENADQNGTTENIAADSLRKPVNDKPKASISGYSRHQGNYKSDDLMLQRNDKPIDILNEYLAQQKTDKPIDYSMQQKNDKPIKIIGSYSEKQRDVSSKQNNNVGGNSEECTEYDGLFVKLKEHLQSTGIYLGGNKKDVKKGFDAKFREKRKQALSGTKSDQDPVSKGCWFDLIEQYVRRKGMSNKKVIQPNSQTLNQDQSLIQDQVQDNTLPVISSVQSGSDVNKHQNDEPLRVWHVPLTSFKPLAPALENSVSRIRVRPFSELSAIAGTSCPTSLSSDQSSKEGNIESLEHLTENIFNGNSISLSSKNCVVVEQPLLQINDLQNEPISIRANTHSVKCKVMKVKAADGGKSKPFLVKQVSHNAVQSNSNETEEMDPLRIDDLSEQTKLQKYVNEQAHLVKNRLNPITNNQMTQSTGSFCLKPEQRSMQTFVLATASMQHQATLAAPLSQNNIPVHQIASEQQMTPISENNNIPVHQIAASNATAGVVWKTPLPVVPQEAVPCSQIITQNYCSGQQTTHGLSNVSGQPYNNVNKTANYYFSSSTQQPTTSTFANPCNVANVAGPSQWPQGNSQSNNADCTQMPRVCTAIGLPSVYNPVQTNVNNSQNFNNSTGFHQRF